MRLLAASFLIVSAVGCHCSPSEPSPVTLRLKNTSGDAIFVDDSNDKLGLTVQRSVNGAWFGFDDKVGCSCQACDQICNSSCTCDAGTTFVRRVMPGETVERTWNGVVQVQALNSCGGFGSGGTCLRPENAPLDESFDLSLCYQLQVSGVDLPDGGRLAAKYPMMGQTCIDKEFHVIDGVVEIGPRKGAACSLDAPCPGPDELCLSGSCTASCPDNGFPTLGAGWALRIEPDDQGFFTSSKDAGATILGGTGKITSVVYNGPTMTARLERTGTGGELLKGALYVTLPNGQAAPLTQGANVSIRMIDSSTPNNPEDRAVVIRDLDGGLLFAADHGQQGALLKAADTAPFTISFASTILGCRFNECGKQLYFQTRFKAGSIESLLDPGKSALVTVPEGAFRVLNVSSASYATTTCKLFDIRPFAIWREKTP
jgi:hypothetical protein